MKKIMMLALLAVVLVSPNLASAQTVGTGLTNDQVQALINNLMAQVAVLVQKLNELLAKQAEDSVKLGSIVTNPVPATPIASPTYTGPSVSIGTPYCYTADPSMTNVKIPVTIVGPGWKYGIIRFSSQLGSGATDFSNSITVIPVGATDNQGTTTLLTELGNQRKEWNSSTPIPQFADTQTVYIGHVCQ